MEDRPAKKSPDDAEKQRHFRALRKRRDWLEARVAVGAEEGKVLYFDELELAALKWALEELGDEQD